MLKRVAVAAVLGLLVAATVLSSAQAQNAVAKSENVKLIKNFPYTNGTDIAFQGKYAYFGQQGDQGGVRILDVSRAVPKQVGFILCPGTQNDVAVVRPGLLALAYHSGQCGGKPGTGVRLIDVRNPRSPKYLSQVELPGGSHTITVYPGTDILYSSPGGLPTNGGGTEQILDASNPNNLKVVGTFKAPNPSGCHDINFARAADGDTMLGFCAGGGEVSIWDVTEETAPVVLSHGFTPSFFPHAAVPTPDGKYLVMTDEAFAVHDCSSGLTGAMWVFDITNPETPVLAGQWGPRRGAVPVGTIASDWCTAHNLNFVGKTRQAVVSWYTGGTSVVDFEDPLSPKEVAYYMPADTDVWSAYFFDGRIYANDLKRGIDVLKVKGLKTK